MVKIKVNIIDSFFLLSFFKKNITIKCKNYNTAWCSLQYEYMNIYYNYNIKKRV